MSLISGISPPPFLWGGGISDCINLLILQGKHKIKNLKKKKAKQYQNKQKQNNTIFNKNKNKE